MEWLAGRPAGSTLPIVLRTRYFDDAMQRAVREQDLRQVVLPAAGLDTRAYRLQWPGDTQWYELDRIEVLAHKAQVLKDASAEPTCKRQAIAADLAGDWTEALQAAGFEPAAPSAWLLEGFLFYLPSETLAQVLETVMGLSAPGSWLGCDVINSAMLTSPYTKAWLEMQARAGAPWIGVLDDPLDFLAEHGWQASLSQAGAPEANFNRWTLPIYPVEMPGVPHNWFVTAHKNG